MKRQRRIWAVSLSVLIMLALLVPTCGCLAASATSIEIDEDWEELYVETGSLEGIYNGAYARFKSKVSNFDDFYLDLNSESSEDTFTAALKKSNIKYDEDFIAHFTAILYKTTDEDDVKATNATELLVPLPDDAQEHPESCIFYTVSGGSAKAASATLCVDDLDTYYYKLTPSNSATYGFVYADPDSFDEDEDIDDEEDPEDDDESDSKAAVTEPSATPTPKPTSKPSPTQAAGSKNSSSKDNSSKNTSANTKKDSIPKTGDEFELAAFCIVACCSGVVFTTAMILRKEY